MTEEETMTEDEKDALEQTILRILHLKQQVSLTVLQLETQFHHLRKEVESSGIQIENLELALAGQPTEEGINWRMALPTDWAEQVLSSFEEEE